jgi:Zn-dependent M28 family amino/carboxypeptidase
VLGILKGSDPELSGEVVIIGAHLDHLGKRGDYVYNGADDNGSGSVAVMEIAEALSLNGVRPRRSVLFALWTGEEKGLLGSRYYVQNPVFPLAKTVACLNLDMISRNYSREGLKRIATRMFKIKDTEKILSRIDISRFLVPFFAESTPGLADLIKISNRHVGLHIYLLPSKGGMGGSDHAPFSMNEVPWVFFSAGITRDYHTPRDSIGKVNFRLLRDITRLTYLTAFGYADK